MLRPNRLAGVNGPAYSRDATRIDGPWSMVDAWRDDVMPLRSSVASPAP